MMSVLTSHEISAMSAALGNLMAPAKPEAKPGAKPISRLLLVDDEPRLLSSLVEFLKDEGHALTTAACGHEAIVRLAEQSFDLILLDLRLPDMTGHDIMDVIRARGLDASVIILSGDVGIDAAIGALRRGAFGYLRKPYAREELLKTVANALSQRNLQAENRRIAWQLECSEKLYRYLVDSSPDIIYTLNTEGYFTFINDSSQQLLGYARGELIGKHYSVLIHPDDMDRARYVFNERRTGERASRNIELRLRPCQTSDGKDAARVFDNTITTISFNSMGIYALGAEQEGKSYFGTYGIARDITERKRAQDLLSHQAYHDILTDLPNRILFRDRLEHAVSLARRNNGTLAVMFIDLDRFKPVNDTFGHLKGDELLKQVAERLKGILRRGDTLARQGGDEFTVLLPDLRSRQNAEIIAEKFLTTLHDPFLLDETEVHLSASIGITVFPGDGETLDDLIRHADMAMYQVKGNGKNGYAFYDSTLDDASLNRIALEHELRHAIEHDQLEMVYQPQVDVSTGRIVGAEALMRWNHAQRGLLGPGEFLPFAEENGLMLPLTDWMIQRLCRDFWKWDAAGGARVQLSFNLSPNYLDRGDFCTKLQRALDQYGIPPTRLEIEITENVCIRNPQHAVEQLNKLASIGVSLAIDDFGTGYSSLSYLHRFPLHTIKVDQSFVREIHHAAGHYPVVLAIISIARGLGFNIIAEGVETASQASYLEQAGCKVMQGYLFHKPISLSQFIDELLRNDAVAQLAAVETSL
jgi:diguanylate cyclase (GGDEF)-like protein/PAS domain S-box-containing protein